MPRQDIKHKIMPFGQHLEELRHRLIYALLGVAPILLVSLVFGKSILRFALRPIQHALHDANLADTVQQTGVVEAFGSYLKVSITLTLVVGLPWVVWQLWMFVAPGLYASERRFAYLLAPLSVLLSTVGVIFCFKIMLPVALAFFINFGASIAEPTVATTQTPAGVTLPAMPMLEADPVEPTPGSYWFNLTLRQMRMCVGNGADGSATILSTPLVVSTAIAQVYRVSEYVGFLLAIIIGFALAFQMPVVVLLLGWAGIVTPKMLTKYRRHAILGCAAASAFITPTPDPFTMILLAGPLYALFELGVVLLRVLPASRVARGLGPRAREAKEDAS